MRREVVIAKRHQGTPFPSTVRCVRSVQAVKFIVDDDGLLSVDQKHAFLNLDAFNLLNTPQFGYPGMTQGTPQFGVVSSQANNPRLIQFGTKLIF